MIEKNYHNMKLKSWKYKRVKEKKKSLTEAPGIRPDYSRGWKGLCAFFPSCFALILLKKNEFKKIFKKMTPSTVNFKLFCYKVFLLLDLLFFICGVWNRFVRRKVRRKVLP